jgi:hypothetical protein
LVGFHPLQELADDFILIVLFLSLDDSRQRDFGRAHVPVALGLRNLSVATGDNLSDFFSLTLDALQIKPEQGTLIEGEGLVQLTSSLG